jgi:methylmalonyl-CoA/ethylmalonyl-CoA epimerase
MANKVKSKSPFSQLSQVGLVVKDMDQVVKRLKALGIGPFAAPVMTPLIGKPVIYGQPSEVKVKGVLCKFAGIDLEVNQPIEGKTPWQDSLDDKGDGIHHLAFLVENVDKEIDKLAKQGLKVIVYTKFEDGSTVAYVDLGVGGLIVELCDNTFS